MFEVSFGSPLPTDVSLGSQTTTQVTITDDDAPETGNLELSALAVTGGTGIMYPVFNPRVHHYALRCPDATTLRVTATARDASHQLKLNNIPVPGMELDKNVVVDRDHDVAIELSDGGESVLYVVHCIPSNFPKIKITKKQAGVSDGLIFWTPQRQDFPRIPAFMAIMDNNGVPRWVRDSFTASATPMNFRRHATNPVVDGRRAHYSVTEYLGSFNGRHVLLDESFKAIKTVETALDMHDTNAHDFLITEDNTFLFSSRRIVSHDFGGETGVLNTYENIIEEVSPTGDTVWSWESWDDHLTIDPDCVGYDLGLGLGRGISAHINALTLIDGDVVASSRGCAQVVRIDRSAKSETNDGTDIVWQLGGTDQDMFPDDRAFLAISGDENGRNEFCRQHHATETASGTVVLFDNGVNCLSTEIEESTDPKRGDLPTFSRVVEYDIDPDTGTAEFHREFRLDRRYGWAPFTGSVDILDNGHWLFTWGYLLYETDPSLSQEERSIALSETDSSGAELLRVNAWAGTDRYMSFRAYRESEADVEIPLNLPVTLMLASEQAAESAGEMVFEVELNVASSEEVSVDYETADGTAQQGTDYRQTTGTLTFLAGETEQTLAIPIINDTADEVEEETFTVTLSNPQGATLAEASATGTILDDDSTPVITTTSPILVTENETEVATLAATDADGRVEDLQWEIAGGADGSKFTLPADGELAFKTAKDYENPDDADRDGDYEVRVRVSDGANPAEADFIVRLQDVDDIAPVFSSALANGATLTLAYSEALDESSVPGNDAFTVTGGNQTRTVTGVVVSGSAVELTLDPAVEYGETGLRVSYTVPTGPGATPIQDLAGNEADGLSNRQVTNQTGDTTGPAVETVAISSNAGSDITYAAEETIEATVTFNETVVVTGTPRLRLQVGGGDRRASYRSVTGGAVRFEYTVLTGDSDEDGVSIEADSLSLNGGTIKDGADNDALLEHDALADDSQHKVDGVAPELAATDGAVVNGATLTLTYDEALNGSSRPATGAYTVTGGNATRTVTGVAVKGRAVELRLDPAVEHGETDLRVSYRPGANPIRDLAGNEAGALTDQEVDNQTPDTTVPELEGIEISSDPGTDETYAAGEAIAVRVRYNEPVRVDTNGGTPALELTVGNRSKTAGYSSGSDSAAVVFVYEVERGEVDEDGVSIPRGRIALNGGTIRDSANNDAALGHDGLAADSGHRVDGVEPKLQSATVHTSRVALTYDELLDEDSIPSALDFTVVVAGNDRPVFQVQVSGKGVTLRLSSPVTAGEAVTVSYTPGFNPVRDQVGNAVEALTDEEALPPLVTISATEGAGSVTEGTAVQFTLTREEPTEAALTVGLSVTEQGAVIETAGSYQPPEEVTFTAGDTTATLTVPTDDDEQQESDGAVIATLQPGTEYRLGETSTQSAQVTVEDDEGGGPIGPGGGLPPPSNPVPSAPRNLEAVGGDQQVTLSWEAPEDDGGFPIADYQYLIGRSGRGWISTESTDTTHTVTGLTNGRLYVFQVRAVNAGGAGSSSNQIEVTPGVGRLEFAHFANGASITSDLVLVNVAHHPIRPSLYFYDREGERIAAESVVEVTEELEVAEDGSLTVQTEMQPLRGTDDFHPWSRGGGGGIGDGPLQRSPWRGAAL